MQPKHSISIFSTNLNLSYKVFIFIFIIFIIASAIFVSIFSTLINEIKSAIELEGVSLSLSDILEDPVVELSNIWHIASVFLSNNYILLITRFLFFALLIVFARFFISLTLMPISMIIYNKMTSGYSNNLFSSLVTNLAQTIGFAFFSSIIYSIIDLAIVFLSLYLFIIFYKILSISALMPSVSLFLLLFSLRATIFSQWLPTVCDGEKNIFKALLVSIKSSLRSISTHYPMSITLSTTYFAVVTCSFLPTFGIFPVFTFPMYIILMCIMNLVSYFNYHGKKYYTDLGATVYVPPLKQK